MYSDGIEAFQGFIANGTEKTVAIGASYETQGYRIGSELAITADVGAFEGKTEISSYQYDMTGVKTPVAKLTVSGAGLVADCPSVDGGAGTSVAMSSQGIDFRVKGLANDPLDASFQFQAMTLLSGGDTSQPTLNFGSAKVMDYRHPIIRVSQNQSVGSDGNSGEVYAYDGTGSVTLTLAAGRLETFFYVANLGTGTVTLVPQNSNYKIIGSKTLTKTGAGKGWKVTKVVGGNGQGTWLVQDADSEAGGLDIATANGLYLPSLQTANTPLSNVTNLQRSFGVIGASNSGAIGLSNTTAQIRLVNKSNTDERLATTCLTLSGITDTVTGTGNLSASSAITSLAKTTRVNHGTLAKTTETLNDTGVTLTLKASSTPNASNGTGDASYTVIGGSVEFVSNTGNGFRYKADHGLTEIAGTTNSTIVDDSYITKKYADTHYATGDLSLYVPRTSNTPLVIETTKQTSMQIGMTLVSKYSQYSSSLAIDGSKGFTLQDMRGSTVKSSTSGEVLIIPDTIQGPSPTKIRVLVGQVDIPVGPSGASDPTGGITIQQGEPIKALVAPANSTFSDPLAYITSGYADATYASHSALQTLPYLTQDIADRLYPTMDGSTTGKFAAYTENAPGYTGQYVLPDGKVMTIQNGAIVSIA